MASRSSVDATRFTATEPHAYSQPSAVHSSTTSSIPSSTQALPQANPNVPGNSEILSNSNGGPPSPSTETPKEKFARLRAARLAQRSVQLTTWERTVIRGRVWADRAHRFTALSLIGFSVVALGVSVFAFTDMIIHNRRRRKAFYNAQHAIYQARVVAAIETDKAGLPLDEDQVLVLARERAKMQLAERKKEQGWLKRFTGLFSKGLKLEMEPIIVPSESAMLERMGVDVVGTLAASQGKAKISEQGDIEGLEETRLAKAVKQKREEMGLEEKMGPEKITTAAKERRGGMLDRIGKRAVSDASAPNNNGWLSWGR